MQRQAGPSVAIDWCERWFTVVSIYGDGHGRVACNSIVWTNLMQGGNPRLSHPGAGYQAIGVNAFTLVGAGVETYGSGYHHAVDTLEDVGTAVQLVLHNNRTDITSRK